MLLELPHDLECLLLGGLVGLDPDVRLPHGLLDEGDGVGQLVLRVDALVGDGVGHLLEERVLRRGALLVADLRDE